MAAFAVPTCAVQQHRPIFDTGVSLKEAVRTIKRTAFLNGPSARRTFFGEKSVTPSSSKQEWGVRRRFLVAADADAHHRFTQLDNAEPAPIPGGADSEIVVTGSESEIAAQRSKFNLWRYRVFAGLCLSYIASYLTRGCFTYAAPVLRSEAGVTLEQIGVISSVFPVAHGISKFASGVIADSLDARWFLAGVIVLSGLLNVAFAIHPSVSWMTFVWGITGWISAGCVPASAKMITAWYTNKERGTWWGIWNSNANIGGFITALVAGTVAAKFGWRMGMQIPGIIGIVMGVLSWMLIRSDPAQAGLPSADAVLGVARPATPKPAAKQQPVAAPGAAAAASAEPVESQRDIFIKYVILNPAVWILAVEYLLLYFVRQGLTNWSHFFLMDTKGLDAAEAAARVSSRELGGLIGNLASGVISDKFFGGRRPPVIAAFLVGILGSLAAFVKFSGISRGLDVALVFLMGMMLYGPHMLIGLCGVEMAHKKAASSAIGLLGLLSYLGAGVAGAPLTMLVKQYGWISFFQAMAASCVVALLGLIPIWNRKAQ
eukprot:tig00000691_g3180.t1